MKWNDEQLKAMLARMEIQQLNEMQLKTLEVSSEQNAFALLSPTGTGKTLAFLLPLLHRLDEKKNGIQALVLAPSRELALQIEDVFRRMGTGFKVNVFYGGHSMRVEKSNLIDPPSVLIGTPGRLADHMRKEHLGLSSIHTIIFDEFDKSLEFGFQKEMEEITSQLDNIQYQYLTSATESDTLPEFLPFPAPHVINFLDGTERPKLKIKAVQTDNEEDDKLDMLFHTLCRLGNEPTLVFCNHKAAVERISQRLWGRGIIHETFHGNLDQQQRERSLVKYRNGSLNILIATDLAARGLDIPEIKHVIHYQIPYDEKTFTHRNGRTARMHAEGTVYFIMAEKDYFPEYLKEDPEIIPFEEAADLPSKPKWVTIFIGGGKKDKINKIDIVGLFCKKGGLEKNELGLIEVKDFYAYAAVKRHKSKNLIKKLDGQRLKKKKVRIQLAY